MARRASIVVGLFIGGAITTAPAVAQVSAPAPDGMRVNGRPAAVQPDSTEEQPDRLNDIVVTAERRDTRLQDTPLSIVALSGAELANRGVNSLADLARFTPGLSSQGLVEGNRPTFTVRGIGQFSGRDAAERGVGVYVDDVYIPRTSGSLLQLLDVERVEVLRGPQGTLFGRNSTGGAIRYITRKPVDRFEGSGLIRIGTMDRTDFSALVNIPFTDKIFGRFQAGLFKRDGYVDFTSPTYTGGKGGDIDDLVIRGALRFVPTDNLDINVGVTHDKSDRGRQAQITLANNAVDAATVTTSLFLQGRGEAPLVANDPRLTSRGYYDNPAECYTYNNTYGFGSPDLANEGARDRRSFCSFFTKDTTTTAFLNADLSLSDAFSVRAISGYLKGESDFNAGADKSDFNSFSQELQLHYKHEWMELVGGLYYFHEHPLRSQATGGLVQVGPARGQCCTGGATTQEFKTDAKGVFGQANFSVTEKLELIGGLRYSYENKQAKIRSSSSPQLSAVNTAAGVGPGTTFRNEDNWSHVDYRATAQYTFTPTFNVYAAVSTGFKAGGFNDNPLSTPLAVREGQTNVADRYIRAFDQEKVTSYEGGVRSEWFDRRLRFNITGFLMQYRNVQISSPVFQIVNGVLQGINVISNAGSVNLSGFETDVGVQPVAGLSLNASAAFLDNDWRQVNVGSAVLRADTCATIPAAQRTLEQCGAADLAGGPRFQYTLSGNYDVAVGSDRIRMSAVYSHVSSKNSFNNQVTNIKVPGYGLLNLRLSYGPADSHWSIAAYATNALDKKYLLVAQNGFSQSGTNIASPGVPREVGLELSARF